MANQPRGEGVSADLAVVDGVLRRDGRADLLVLGAGLLHGEGLFETIAMIDGTPHHLHRHLERMREGAEFLGLLPFPGEEVWWADMQALARASTEAAGSAGEGLAVRLLLLRDGDRVRRLVGARPLGLDPVTPARIDAAGDAFQGPRPLARFKTLNYLVSRLAWQQGAARGQDEVLFLTRDGMVLEGTKSTVFCVRRGVLWTAPLSLPILPGVTRAVLLEQALKDGIPVREEPYSFEELQGAEEVFLSASLRGVRPVEQVGAARPTHVDGPVTRRLASLYRSALA